MATDWWNDRSHVSNRHFEAESEEEKIVRRYSRVVETFRSALMMIKKNKKPSSVELLKGFLVIVLPANTSRVLSDIMKSLLSFKIKDNKDNKDNKVPFTFNSSPSRTPTYYTTDDIPKLLKTNFTCKDPKLTALLHLGSEKDHQVIVAAGLTSICEHNLLEKYTPPNDAAFSPTYTLRVGSATDMCPNPACAHVGGGEAHNNIAWSIAQYLGIWEPVEWSPVTLNDGKITIDDVRGRVDPFDRSVTLKLPAIWKSEEVDKPQNPRDAGFEITAHDLDTLRFENTATANKLIALRVENARKRGEGLFITPQCPFVQSFPWMQNVTKVADTEARPPVDDTSEKGYGMYGTLTTETNLWWKNCKPDIRFYDIQISDYYTIYLDYACLRIPKSSNMKSWNSIINDLYFKIKLHGNQGVVVDVTISAHVLHGNEFPTMPTIEVQTYNSYLGNTEKEKDMEAFATGTCPSPSCTENLFSHIRSTKDYFLYVIEKPNLYTKVTIELMHSGVGQFVEKLVKMPADTNPAVSRLQMSTFHTSDMDQSGLPQMEQVAPVAPVEPAPVSLPVAPVASTPVASTPVAPLPVAPGTVASVLPDDFYENFFVD